MRGKNKQELEKKERRVLKDFVKEDRKSDAHLLKKVMKKPIPRNNGRKD